MEFGAGVAEPFLARAEGAEILSGLWDDIVVEVEVDASGLLCERRSVSGNAMCQWGGRAKGLRPEKRPV